MTRAASFSRVCEDFGPENAQRSTSNVQSRTKRSRGRGVQLFLGQLLGEHEPCTFPLTRRFRATLSHRMGEGWGEGVRFMGRGLKHIATALVLAFGAATSPVQGADEEPQFEIVARTGGGSGFTQIGRGPSINNRGYVAFTARTADSNGTEFENVYAVAPDSARPQKLMNEAFEYPITGGSPTQVFDDHVQVNDVNEVLAWRNLNALVQLCSWIFLPMWGDSMTAPLSYWESWPVSGVNSAGLRGMPEQQIRMGNGGGGDILTLGPYFGVTSLYFMNPATGRVYPSPFEYRGYDGFNVPVVYRYGSFNRHGQAAFAAKQHDGAQIMMTRRVPGGNAAGTGSNIVRPWIADDGYSVFRFGTAADGSLFRSPYSIFPIQTVTSTGAGLETLGHPTISDDGKIIVFYAHLTNTNLAAAWSTTNGPGMFAYFTENQLTIRVTGKADPNDPQPGGIVSYSSEERPSVNNLGTVVFTARNDQNQRAIFSTVINLKSTVPTALPPTQVVAVGDEIDGLPGTVEDLEIYDALNNKDKYGEIVFWTTCGGVQAVVKVPAAACESCMAGCEFGGCEAHTDSLSVKMGLGRTATSSRSSYLKIKAQVPSPDLSTPAGLGVSANGAFARLYATNAFSSAKVLRQVKGPNTLTDIVPESPYRYTVRFYNEFGACDAASGLYPPSGSPLSTILVENPDGGASFDRLRVTRNSSESWLFTYTPGTGAWELLSGVANALRKETLVKATNGVFRTETRLVQDAANKVLSETLSTYQTFPWGDELAQTVTDPAGLAKTTTYTYYTNQTADAGNYGKLRSVVYPEGRWEFYKEYSGDAVTKQVLQFQNNPYTETTDWPDPNNRCSETAHSGGLETHVEYLKGQAISKRWRNQASPSETWDCVATTPAATDYKDPSNLITKTFAYTATDANGASVGQTAKVINPDGTMSQYFYYDESIDDPYYTGAGTPPKIETTRTVSLSGQPSADQTAVIEGTRSEQVVDALGNQISRRDYDVATGALLAQEITTGRDWLGRATRTDYLDGTYVTRMYDCCGLALETDREGVTTTYSTEGTFLLDLAGTGTPQVYAGSSTTRAGLTTYTLTDAMGRSTHTILQGANGAVIVQEQRGYDSQGDLAWSLDAENRRTTYSTTTDGPFRVAITTFPDGSESIESTYQDGSAYETKGNAVQGMRYSYGLVEDNGVWVQTTTQTRLEPDGSLSPEYSTTYTDFAGRAYKTEYPWPDGPGPVFATRAYNAQGQLAQSTDPDGLTTLYAYNGRGELETTALDLANPGFIDFDGTDRITRTTSLVEDSAQRGTVVRKTVTEVWQANGVDQPTVLQTSETSADGTQAWSTQYGLTTHSTTAIDRANQRRTATTQHPDGTSIISVSEQGRQKSVTRLDNTGARVSQTLFAFDSFGRLQAQTDARNGPTTYTYYVDGQIHTVTTPDPDPGAAGPGLDPQTTSYAYYRDPASGIKTVITLPDGDVVTQEYFPSGQLKKTWGARTYPAEYTYDRAGRMATLTTWQQFDFDTGTGLAGSATTRWNYNARGLLANKRYADNKGPSYTYTAGGKPKTRLWARGVLTTYGYDPRTGDLLTTTYSDTTPAVTNNYDRSGQLQSVLDASGLRTFGYRHGQTVTEAYGSGLFAGLTLLRDYDDLDRQSALSVTSPTGAIYHVTYGYDAASRLDTVTSGADVARYTYHPDADLVHTLTQSHSNAVRLVTTKLYDKLGRLQSITSLPSADSPISFAYDYNDDNQRTRATLANGEYWTYAYDALGQVTNGVKRFPNAAPIPGYTFGYQFDHIGNRLAAIRDGKTDAYTNNVLNQIASIHYSPWLHVLGQVTNNASITVNGQTPVRSNGYFYAQLAATSVWNTVTIQARAIGQATNGTDALAEETGHLFQPTNAASLQYDDDGNLLSDGRWSMTWDAENRIIKKESLPTVPQAAQRRLEYTLDAIGRRVLVRSSDRNSATWQSVSSRRWLANQLQMLAQMDVQANSMIQSYIWGLDLTGTRDGAGGVGGLLRLESEVAQPTAVHIAVLDGNGNVQKLIYAVSGARSAQYEYDPSGTALCANGFGAGLNTFRFSTKFTEVETGDVHYELRDYRPRLGRWLTRDSVAEKGGMNLYGMIGNDLLNRWDLWGLICPVNITVGGIPTGKIYTAQTYPDRDNKAYQVPVYTLTVSEGMGTGRASRTWDALRFMPFLNATPGLSGYSLLAMNPIMVGLADLLEAPSPLYKPDYSVHNRPSTEDGAFVIPNHPTHYIHAGPMTLSSFGEAGWGSAGCIEVVGFTSMKAYVHSLSGLSTKAERDALTELVQKKLLTITLERAVRPSIVEIPMPPGFTWY